MTTTPNSVNELLNINEERKQQEESETPNPKVLFAELDKLSPVETAFLIKNLVEKVTTFHQFVINKRIEEGINTEEQLHEYSLWLLDSKSWKVILQEIQNISDFCD